MTASVNFFDFFTLIGLQNFIRRSVLPRPKMCCCLNRKPQQEPKGVKLLLGL